MAGSLSAYASNKLLDHLLGVAAFTMPTNVFVKLHTADPGTAGTTAAAATTTRKQLAFGAAASAVSTQSGTVTWSAVGTAETITHISIWDNLTAGNFLARGALTTSVTTVVGDDITLSALTVATAALP